MKFGILFRFKYVNHLKLEIRNLTNLSADYAGNQAFFQFQVSNFNYYNKSKLIYFKSVNCFYVFLKNVINPYLFKISLAASLLK